MSVNREIVVKGIGKASVIPDMIILEMKLETINLQYDVTMKHAEELADTLRKAIISAGHNGKDLKTTDFNIKTKYENFKVNDLWKEKFIGYYCSHSLKLEFDLDMQKLECTINSIAKSNAKPRLSINFSIKDSTSVSELLLQNAIENAKSKAEILTKSAGVKLGEVKRIDYNWGELHMYSKTNYDLDEDAVLCQAIQIEPENINVNDTVTVVWEIN